MQLRPLQGLHSVSTFRSMKVEFRNSVALRQDSSLGARPFARLRAGHRMLGTNRCDPSTLEPCAASAVEMRTAYEGLAVEQATIGERNEELAGICELRTEEELAVATAVDMLLDTKKFPSDFSFARGKFLEWQEDNGPSMAALEETVLGMISKSGKPRRISAVVSGTGLGKSHMLYELARRLNRRSDTMAVMIDVRDGDISKGISDAEALLVVIGRILFTVFTGFESSYSGYCLSNAIELAAQQYGIDKASTATPAFMQEMLRVLMATMSERHSLAEGKSTITKFVLLVDEIHRLVDYGGARRLPSLISNAIVPTADGDRRMQKVDGYLVLSSKDVDVLDMKLLGRGINPLSLPTHLNAEKVVRDWLPRADSSWTGVYETDKLLAHTAELLVSTVAQIPYFSETMINDKLGKLSKDSFARMVERGELPSFFHNTTDMISLRNVKTSGSVPVSVAHGIVYQHKIAASSDTKDLSYRSFLTSSPLDHAVPVNDMKYFVPKTCVWSMMKLSGSNRFLFPVNKLLTNLMARVPTGARCTQQDVAGMVHAIVRGVIELHVSISGASSKPQSVLDLAELFHVQTTANQHHRKAADLLGRFGTFPFRELYDDSFRVRKPRPPSSANCDSFLADLDKVILGWDRTTAAEVALHEVDAAEGLLLWMLRNASGEIVALFVDVDVESTSCRRIGTESDVVASDNTVSSTGRGTTLKFASSADRWERARHIAAIAERASQRSDWKSKSLAEALAAKRYLHVQLRAGDAEGVEAAANEELNAVVLGADVVQRMMGPFETVYRSALRFGELCGDEK